MLNGFLQINSSIKAATAFFYILTYMLLLNWIEIRETYLFQTGYDASYLLYLSQSLNVFCTTICITKVSFNTALCSAVQSSYWNCIPYITACFRQKYPWTIPPAKSKVWPGQKDSVIHSNFFCRCCFYPLSCWVPRY